MKSWGVCCIQASIYYSRNVCDVVVAYTHWPHDSEAQWGLDHKAWPRHEGFTPNHCVCQMYFASLSSSTCKIEFKISPNIHSKLLQELISSRQPLSTWWLVETRPCLWFHCADTAGQKYLVKLAEPIWWIFVYPLGIEVQFSYFSQSQSVIRGYKLDWPISLVLTCGVVSGTDWLISQVIML